MCTQPRHLRAPLGEGTCERPAIRASRAREFPVPGVLEGGGMSHAYSPGWRRFSVVVLRPLLFGMLKRDWRGQENIPREGGLIIVANHISEADPLALALFVYE